MRETGVATRDGSGVPRRTARGDEPHERLRGETDLPALLAGVREVAGRTVEPAHVSMWVPAAPPGTSGARG